MGRTYTNVKVNREKLIQRLEEKVQIREKESAKQFKEELKKKIKTAKDSLKSAELNLAKLEAVTSIEDVQDEYWGRNYLNGGDLEKQINLLKMSDQEELLVSPTSNLYSYL